MSLVITADGIETNRQHDQVYDLLHQYEELLGPCVQLLKGGGGSPHHWCWAIASYASTLLDEANYNLADGLEVAAELASLARRLQCLGFGPRNPHTVVVRGEVRGFWKVRLIQNTPHNPIHQDAPPDSQS